MGIYEEYELDRECTEKGVWLEILSPDTGKLVCKVRVRPADPDDNPDYRKAAADLVLEAAGKDNAEDRPDWVPRLYARAVVTDWDGVTDRKGKALECTEENVYQILKDLPQVYKTIRRHAQDWRLYRAKFEEAASKN
jgi:hypothetical protein